uniref:Transposase (Putative), gypsy type n=1 Tax=Tanacetum cinerariifolium TaxID=118510 RepID=A0A699HBB9_TANCI|nr:hypothetical protein [Tanacetum cinerariifolium]
MSSIDDIESILTQSGLDALCEKFHIPPTVHPELPGHNSRIRNKIDLFAFINHADPTKVRIREREGAGNDIVNEEGGEAAVADQTEQSDHKVRKMRKADDGANGFVLPPKNLKEDHGASGDVGASTVGISLAALQGLLDSITLAVEPALERFVVLSNSSHHSSTNAADDEVTSVARSSIPPLYVLTAVVSTTIIADATSTLVPRAGAESDLHSIFKDSASTGEANQDVAETLRQIYIPKWNVTNDYAFDEHDICHGVIDHLAPPAFFSQLRSMDYEQLFMEFNVGAARQTCLSSEEQNATLEGQVAALESSAVTKVSELASSNTHISKLTQDLSSLQLSCDELSIKASSLKFEKYKLVGQVSKLEGTCFELRDEVPGYKLFKEQVEAVQELWAQTYGYEMLKITGIPCALGGAIGLAIDKGMQGELVADIDHGKAERGLTDVAAYDPSAEANYIFAEGPVAETPEASQLQPSPKQIMLPIYRLEDQVLSISDALVPLIELLSAKNLVGEVSTSGVPVTDTTTALSTTFIQASTVPPVSSVDHEAFSARPSTEVPSPSKITFEREELETTLEHTTAS